MHSNIQPCEQCYNEGKLAPNKSLEAYKMLLDKKITVLKYERDLNNVISNALSL